MDYGPEIDINQVLTPAPEGNLRPGELCMNWTVPYGFTCSREIHCFSPQGSVLTIENILQNSTLASIAATLGANSLYPIPFYRHVFKKKDKFHINRSMFRDLELALPGFQVETGMACSLGSLLHLSARVSQFEPELFTKILPALQDKNALVLALYIRTGQTDHAAHAEKNRTHVKEDAKAHQDTALPVLKCAVNVENDYLSGLDKGHAMPSRIVWFLATDSTNLKDWIRETYSGRDVNVHVSEKQKRKMVKREIVLTGARGAHTRTSRSPSTADFAEALIDWYLIGESDVVITVNHWFSFGTTAALRTARPIYSADKKCSRLKWIHEDGK